MALRRVAKLGLIKREVDLTLKNRAKFLGQFLKASLKTPDPVHAALELLPLS